MKQITNLKSLFINNVKHGLYALMVLTLSVAIPALSYVELSHSDATKKEVVKENNMAKEELVTIQKQS